MLITIALIFDEICLLLLLDNIAQCCSSIDWWKWNHLQEFLYFLFFFLLQTRWKWLLRVDEIYFFFFSRSDIEQIVEKKKEFLWCNNWTFCCRPQSTRRVVVGIKVLLLFLHNHLYQISSFLLVFFSFTFYTLQLDTFQLILFAFI
jgi:hypothetical protein